TWLSASSRPSPRDILHCRYPAATSLSLSAPKRIPSSRRLSRHRLLLDKEPLWTRHTSSPVENGCDARLVTALSVAIRVCPRAWLAVIESRPNSETTLFGRPVSL